MKNNGTFANAVCSSVRCELLGFDIVAFLESVNTTAGVDKLLLARKERMAVGANIHAKVFLGGGSLNNFAACATDRRLLILGMNTLFHSCHLFIKYKMVNTRIITQ